MDISAFVNMAENHEILSAIHHPFYTGIKLG